MVKLIGDQIFDGQLTVPKEEENGEFIWCTSIFISPVINVDVWEVKHILLNDIIWMEFLAQSEMEKDFFYPRLVFLLRWLLHVLYRDAGQKRQVDDKAL